MRNAALTGLVVLSGIGLFAVGPFALAVAEAGAYADARATPIAANRHAATLEAGQLLAGVALPPDATPSPQEPAGDTGQLAAPQIGAFFAAEVDRHAFWTTSASPAATVAAFQSQLPSGAKLVTSQSQPARAGAAYALGTHRRFVVGPEQIMLSAVTLQDGLTGVRADAQVEYHSPRPPSERIPASARLVQITKTGIGGKPLASLLVRSRPVVRALARVVDALPFVGNHIGAFACPAFGPPFDTFVFRATPGGPALATVSEAASTPTYPFPCFPTTLTVRGQRLRPLLDGGILLARAGKLVGLRLTG